MTATSVTLAAPAKINLALHVTGRRPDGYHLLDSLVVFADVGDVVEIAPSRDVSLEVTGPFAEHAPGDRRDLAWRAAEAFFAAAGMAPGARLRIAKNIPAGAGLGGGSADAAAVLSGLNRLTGAALSADALAALGLALGADVPMCLAGCALRAGGIGETIETIADWPALPLVLIWPGRPVPTADVFRSLSRRDNPPLGALPVRPDAGGVAAWLQDCRNDLEAPARAVAPEIGAALDALRAAPGCLVARMSGSGSACFGVFRSDADARGAATSIAAAAPGWWVKAARSG